MEIKIQTARSSVGTGQRGTLGIVQGDGKLLEEVEDHAIKGRVLGGVIGVQMVPREVKSASGIPDAGDVETVVRDNIPDVINKIPLGLIPERKPQMPGMKVEAGDAGHLPGRHGLKETVRLPERNAQAPQSETDGPMDRVIPLRPLAVGVAVVPELIPTPPHEVGEIEHVTDHTLSGRQARAWRECSERRGVRMTRAGTRNRRWVNESGVKVDNGEFEAWDTPRVEYDGKGVCREVPRGHDEEVEEKKSFCWGIR